MNPFLLLRVAYDLTLLVVCLVAFRFGGRPERIGALIMLAGSLLTLGVEEGPFFDWRTGRTPLLLVDLCVLAAFVALALRTDRFWPLWVSAFHLIAVTTHLVILVEPARVLQAYAIAQGFWAYPMFTGILIGSLRHWRRARRSKPPPQACDACPGDPTAP